MLSEILVLPCATERAKSKRKPALNSKAICITEDEVLHELERKECEKAEMEKEKAAKKLVLCSLGASFCPAVLSSFSSSVQLATVSLLFF